MNGVPGRAARIVIDIMLEERFLCFLYLLFAVNIVIDSILFLSVFYSYSSIYKMGRLERGVSLDGVCT